MEFIYPDLSWYTGISKQNNVPPRCPYANDVFGLFAVSLHRYADEIDRDTFHVQLRKKAYPKDWRWNWAHVEPVHYLECTIYSQLISQPTPNSTLDTNPQEMLEIKPGFMGISLNIRVLLTHLCKWWLSKQKQ